MNEEKGSLTSPNNWNDYYRGKHLDSLETQGVKYYVLSILNEEVFSGKAKTIFELGCGASQILLLAAKKGLEVSGIDFNKESIDSLFVYLQNKRTKVGKLICQDIYKYDCTPLSNQYDIVISSGFIEHFSNPTEVIRKWQIILKPGGKMICMIPNFLSINAEILKKYDLDSWKRHKIITPKQLDEMHVIVGLEVNKAAIYVGKFDQDMLIPWKRIFKRFPMFIYRLLRYSITTISFIISLIIKDKVRYFNPMIYGIYEKKGD